jgi:hypothetical protein
LRKEGVLFQQFSESLYSFLGTLPGYDWPGRFSSPSEVKDAVELGERSGEGGIVSPLAVEIVDGGRTSPIAGGQFLEGGLGQSQHRPPPPLPRCFLFVVRLLLIVEDLELFLELFQLVLIKHFPRLGHPLLAVESPLVLLVLSTLLLLRRSLLLHPVGLPFFPFHLGEPHAIVIVFGLLEGGMELNRGLFAA